MAKSDTILVTVRGKDEPGITSCLTKVIADGEGVRILDIEQTVVHGKLILSILLGFKNGGGLKSPILKELLFAAKEIGVGLDFEIFEDTLRTDEDKFEYVIICLGEEVGAKELSSISTELAARGINIDKIARLSHGNIRCIELVAHADKPMNLKRLSLSLLPISSKIGVDLAVQKYGLLRQSKRLVVIDMDSTLIQNEVIDEVAKMYGKFKKVSEITEKVISGKMSFRDGMMMRVDMLKGMKEVSLKDVYKKIRLTKGTENFIKVLKKLGYKTAIISGGFSYFTDRLKKRLGFDYAFANELEVQDGKLTGRIRGNVVDGKRKAKLLARIAKEEGIDIDQTIAIGDGANDIEMIARAGLGIAFNAKQIVKEKSHCSISKHKTLDSILFILGIPEKEVLKLKKSKN